MGKCRSRAWAGVEIGGAGVKVGGRRSKEGRGQEWRYVKGGGVECRPCHYQDVLRTFAVLDFWAVHYRRTRHLETIEQYRESSIPIRHVVTAKTLRRPCWRYRFRHTLGSVSNMLGNSTISVKLYYISFTCTTHVITHIVITRDLAEASITVSFEYYILSSELFQVFRISRHTFSDVFKKRPFWN